MILNSNKESSIKKASKSLGKEKRIILKKKSNFKEKLSRKKQ